MILCLGDSLTFGNIGYSCIKFMSREIKAVNKGKNGDTTKCCYQRLVRYLQKPVYDQFDTYIVEIGANDILLPYLAELSLFWKILSKRRCRRRKCITDDAQFEREYEKFILLLKEKKKRIVLVGMPLPELKDFPLEAICRRNAIIYALAEKHKVHYVDTYSLMKDIVKDDLKQYSWGATNFPRMLDGLIMTLLPFFKDWFSKARKLSLTVDGAHFNSKSAKLIAKAIEVVLLLQLQEE